MRSARRRLAALALVVTAIACGDYARTNPYDVAVPVQVNVLGPDTVFSFREIASFGAQTVPIFPDTAIAFATSDSAAFVPSGKGSFISISPPLYPLTKAIIVYALIGQLDTVLTTQVFPPIPIGVIPPFGVTLIPPPPLAGKSTFIWRHGGYKFVVLTQRVVRIRLRCPTLYACDTLAVGGAATVWVDGTDAGNSPVNGLSNSATNPLTGTPIATFAVRDTTIASVAPNGTRAANVTALKSGSTWIVGTRGALIDSLLIVVR